MQNLPVTVSKDELNTVLDCKCALALISAFVHGELDTKELDGNRTFIITPAGSRVTMVDAVSILDSVLLTL